VRRPRGEDGDLPVHREREFARGRFLLRQRPAPLAVSGERDRRPGAPPGRPRGVPCRVTGFPLILFAAVFVVFLLRGVRGAVEAQVLTAGRRRRQDRRGEGRCSSRCVREIPWEVRHGSRRPRRKNRFSVLGVHDVGERLRAKDCSSTGKFYVYVGVQPRGGEKGARHERPDRNALPCRVSIYTDGGEVRPRDVEATAMMAMSASRPRRDRREDRDRRSKR